MNTKIYVINSLKLLLKVLGVYFLTIYVAAHLVGVVDYVAYGISVLVAIRETIRIDRLFNADMSEYSEWMKSR